MTHQDHIRAAFRFLELADTFDVGQDALAKSEMLWCAAAHVVKAVLSGSSGETSAIVAMNSCLTQRPRLTTYSAFLEPNSDFNIADRLHRNMYEGFMRGDEIADAERRVRRFVNRMANATGD